MNPIDELREKANALQGEYDRMGKCPLVVSVDMTAPFSTTDYIRLDGVLARYGLQKAIGDEFYNLDPNNRAQRMHAPTPLSKITDQEGRWWWECSFGIPSYHRDQIVSWKKRWDEENDDIVSFGKALPRVDHKAGFYKAYSMPLVVKNATNIKFCCVGNKGEVENLLSQWWFVGKKTSQGYGQIKKVVVDLLPAGEHNWSCYDESGMPTRAIPVGVGNGNVSLIPGMSFSQCTYHPPYWDSTEADWCYKP